MILLNKIKSVPMAPNGLMFTVGHYWVLQDLQIKHSRYTDMIFFIGFFYMLCHQDHIIINKKKNTLQT